jgi:hypothetical protein
LIFAKIEWKDIFAKIEWKDTSKNPTGSKTTQSLPLGMIWTW